MTPKKTVAVVVLVCPRLRIPPSRKMPATTTPL
jgi:hypothetical protein